MSFLIAAIQTLRVRNVKTLDSWKFLQYVYARNLAMGFLLVNCLNVLPLCRLRFLFSAYLALSRLLASAKNLQLLAALNNRTDFNTLISMPDSTPYSFYISYKSTLVTFQCLTECIVTTFFVY